MTFRNVNKGMKWGKQQKWEIPGDLISKLTKMSKIMPKLGEKTAVEFGVNFRKWFLLNR